MRLNGTVFRHIWQMTISNILQYKGSTTRQFGHFQVYKRYFFQNVNQNEDFYLISSNRSSSTEVLESKYLGVLNENFSLKRTTVQYTSSIKRLRTSIKFFLRVRQGLEMLMATMSITMKNIKRFWGILINQNEFYKCITLGHFLKP